MKKNSTIPETGTPAAPVAGVPESKAQPSLAMQIVVGVAMQNGIPDYQALADAAGMTRPQVSRYVRGLAQPSLENFFRLCRAAGVRVSMTNSLRSSLVVKIE